VNGQLIRVRVVEGDPMQIDLVQRGRSGDGFLLSAWQGSKLRVLTSQLGVDSFISKRESVLAVARRLHDL
jgi:hypothetical protein